MAWQSPEQRHNYIWFGFSFATLVKAFKNIIIIYQIKTGFSINNSKVSILFFEGGRDEGVEILPYVRFKC